MKRLVAAPPPTEVLASRIDAIVAFDRRARLGEIRCPGLDPFFELHVWAWRDNPLGAFVDWNNAVTCELQ